MLSYTQEFHDAIGATDREIRGYLQFANGYILRGNGGLISFKVTNTAMDAERFCVGSVTSSMCEASFYNDGLSGSGVSLANTYFDAYIGVANDDNLPSDSDYRTQQVYQRTGYFTTDGVFITSMNAFAEVGAPVTLTVDGVAYSGVVSGTVLRKTVVFDESPGFTLATAIQNMTPTWKLTPETEGNYSVSIDVSVLSVEYKCMGRFFVSEITRSTQTTRVLGYDIAGRLSIDYVPTVAADPDDGYLVMDILNDIIDQTGVNNGEPFTDYGNNTYVPKLFTGTCRDEWGWLCTIVDGTNPQSFTGSRTTLGNVEAKTVVGATAYTIDESTTYMDGLSIGDEFTITSFTTGTTDEPIVIGNGTGMYGLNPYITQTVAESIEATMDGTSYYPMTLRWRGDPCLEILDEVSVTSGENTYTGYVMKLETTFNGGLEQSVTCWGDSEDYYAMSTSPMQSNINRVSNLVQEIQQAIETADGGVITKILDTDGTWKELVIANNQDLNAATSVWRFNINGLAHSNRYQGGTYTLAMDTQGRIVANVIQTGILQDATGNNSWDLDNGVLTLSGYASFNDLTTAGNTTINGANITTGIIKDATGKNSWNLNTGAFTITNGSLNITTSSETSDQIILQYTQNGITYSLSLSPSAINLKASGGSMANRTMQITRANMGIRFFDDGGTIGGIGSGNVWSGGGGFGGVAGKMTLYLANGNVGNQMVAAGDSVIAKGTTSGWHWRTWYSGFKECWYKRTANVACTSAWGNQYTSGGWSRLTYPFTFSSAPHEIVTSPGSSTTSSGSCWVIPYGNSSGPTTTQTGQYQVVRPTSTTTNFTIEYYACGY